MLENPIPRVAEKNKGSSLNRNDQRELTEGARMLQEGKRSRGENNLHISTRETEDWR